MPNGFRDFDFTELESFFAPLTEVITGFVQRHNLLLEKYYHEAPVWSCLFRHPKGGIAKIDVERKDPVSLGISCSWWYDDYDSATHYLRTVSREVIQADPSLLEGELETALSEILSWRFGAWDKSQTGCETWWETWTKEQFLNLCKQYPEATP